MQGFWSRVRRLKVYILVPVSKSIGTIVIAVRYNENLIPWKMLQIQEKISFLAETSQNFNLHTNIKMF